jgi:hypothetical protein
MICLRPPAVGAPVDTRVIGDSEPGDLMLLLTLCDRPSI